MRTTWQSQGGPGVIKKRGRHRPEMATSPPVEQVSRHDSIRKRHDLPTRGHAATTERGPPRILLDSRLRGNDIEGLSRRRHMH